MLTFLEIDRPQNMNTYIKFDVGSDLLAKKTHLGRLDQVFVLKIVLYKINVFIRSYG